MKVRLTHELDQDTQTKVEWIGVKVGDVVAKGEELLQLEGSKSSLSVLAEESYQIEAVLVEVGQEVTNEVAILEVKQLEPNCCDTSVVKVSVTDEVAPDSQTLIAEININVGDKVVQDQELFQLEGNKSTVPVLAPSDGIVKQVLVNTGEKVMTGTVLCEIEGETQPSNCSQSKAVKQEVELTPDLLIIGAGPGGYVAALYAAKQGKQVVLVEKEALGGTCLNVGCIPTKALVKSAEVYHQFTQAAEFGIEVSDYSVNMGKVLEKKEAICQKLVSGIDSLVNEQGIKLIKGQAQFKNNQQVLVENKDTQYVIQATDTIIATGSKHSKLPISGIEQDFVLTSTTALSYPETIDSITIIGGGVIGMEFAFMYANFGTKVTVVEFSDHLLPMLDVEVSLEIQKIAEEKGIQVLTQTAVQSLHQEKNGQGVAVCQSVNQTDSFFIASEKVLVAVGREANLDGLGLENTDIELREDQKAIVVNEELETNVPHIYGIGDVIGGMQLAHVASHEGICVVDHLLGHNHTLNYDLVPSVIFTDPEIATVGLNEETARLTYPNLAISQFPFQANGKALTMREEKGFIKLMKDLDSQQLIGGTIIGPEASALISSLTLMIGSNLSEKQILQTVFAHPTTGEVIHEATLGFSIGALHYQN
ncbi:dihydrolipoyl dehydrogenase [Vagococcus humatus]|uniref:Dihydrolipoyl dehydrogenase n=1 Tax=Vagococcus humatus TaxID=1889241 RepID=A0A429Z945_9ENTE|nr:dihydrolipoyl dehydrogenase [Vagococcus humatus]RST90175.1 dihydrolipoyl dehydrogenase [Vagococcus humatus]